MTTYANIKEVLNTIKMNVEYLGTGKNIVPSKSDWDAHHFKCVLKFEGRQMTVVFSKGRLLKGEPTVKEVLECLVSDVSLMNSIRDFRDFVDALGYDVDSKEDYDKTLKNYNRSVAEAKKTVRFLGSMSRVNLLYDALIE